MSNQHKKSCKWCGVRKASRKATVEHQLIYHIFKPDWDGTIHLDKPYQRRNIRRQTFKCTSVSTGR